MARREPAPVPPGESPRSACEQIGHRGAPVRKVVIVGGGFGGLAAAHELRHSDVEVTLVDRMHHHLFQPLLYQVAGGGLAAGECAEPIRTALGRNSNTTVLMAEAEPRRREAHTDPRRRR